MYHELELAGRPLCDSAPGYRRYVVGAGDFEAQLRGLARAGFKGVAVGEALAWTATAPAVAITFDDGCETDLIAAAPRLAAVGFGATFYVTVEFIGRRGFLSPAQLRELADLGFEIGSHALTHSFLSDLSLDRVRAEIVGSKERLEDIAGRPVAHLSCPGGRWSPAVARLAREAGYRSVATSRPGVNRPDSNAYELTRVAVLGGASESAVLRAARGEGLRRQEAKGAALGLAKRVLGNQKYEWLRAALLRRPGSRE